MQSKEGDRLNVQCGIKDVRRYEFAANHRCLAGVTTMTVGVDGESRPCFHLNVFCGNIISQGADLVWKNMIEWRGKEFLSESCKKYSLLGRCGGGCKMEAKTAGGDDPFISIDDVEFVSKTLAMQDSPVEINLPDSFKLNPAIKWRDEPFGAIISVSAKQVCYLDAEAAAMLKGLSFSDVYCLTDLERRHGEGIESFLTQLYGRKAWIDVD